MNISHIDEIDRIDKIKSGQMVYFSDLIRDYQQFVYLTVLKMVHNQMDAEEITQDVFVKVYRKLESFRGDSKFTTWIYKIAYNACLDHLKNKQTSFEKSALSHDEKISEKVTVSSDELSDQIKSIINTLPDKMRMVMILFYLQQFSYIEIADIMEESISNIKTLLFRGRNELKSRMSLKKNERAI